MPAFKHLTAKQLKLSQHGLYALLTARTILKKLVKGERVDTQKYLLSFQEGFVGNPPDGDHTVPFVFNMNYEHKRIRSRSTRRHCGTAGCVLGIIELFTPADRDRLLFRQGDVLNRLDSARLQRLFYPQLRNARTLAPPNNVPYGGIHDHDALAAVTRFLKTGIIQYKDYAPEDR